MRVRGIYDGTHVRLLDPVTIPPNTEVDVLLPDTEEQRQEHEFLQRLLDLGIITEIRHPEEWDDSFDPVPNPGEPISETIIRERR
jgi:hypothetical protein